MGIAQYDSRSLWSAIDSFEASREGNKGAIRGDTVISQHDNHGYLLHQWSKAAWK